MLGDSGLVLFGVSMCVGVGEVGVYACVCDLLNVSRVMLNV